MKTLAKVEHEGQKYSLIASGRDEVKYDSNEKDNSPAWRALTVVRNDEKTRQVVQKVNKGKLTDFALSVFGLMISSMATFGFFKLLSAIFNAIAVNSDSFILMILIVIVFLLIFASALIACLTLVATLITGSILIDNQVRSTEQRYVNNLVFGPGHKELNQYSLIDWNSQSRKKGYKADLARLQSFVNTLSADELVEFMVKGYERGPVALNSKKINQILSNNDGTVSEFLAKEASETLKEINFELEEFSSLRIKYESMFNEYCVKQAKLAAAKDKAKEVSNTKKTSDEQLLEVLSNRNAV